MTKHELVKMSRSEVVEKLLSLRLVKSVGVEPIKVDSIYYPDASPAPYKRENLLVEEA